MKIDHLSLAQRLALLFLTAAILAMSSFGCNTANGFGKDMEQAGEKIQDGTK